MPAFDEKALRKLDGFQEGYAVELADGQKWTLPPVRMRVYPRDMDDGSVEAVCRPWYADQMEKEIDVLFGVTEADFTEIWTARLTITSRLLRSNYDLPPGGTGVLLSYVPGDALSEARWDKIRSAILGRDPDASAEGDDPKAEADTSDGSA